MAQSVAVGSGKTKGGGTTITINGVITEVEGEKESLTSLGKEELQDDWVAWMAILSRCVSCMHDRQCDRKGPAYRLPSFSSCQDLSGRHIECASPSLRSRYAQQELLACHRAPCLSEVAQNGLQSKRWLHL